MSSGHPRSSHDQDLPAYPDKQSLVEEYARLMLELPRTPQVATRISEILEIAETDPKLSQRLLQIDSDWAHHQGLLSPEQIQQFEHKLCRLQEFFAQEGWAYLHQDESWQADLDRLSDRIRDLQSP